MSEIDAQAPQENPLVNKRLDELYSEDCTYTCEYGGTMNVSSVGR